MGTSSSSHSHGSVELTLLTDEGEEHLTLAAGSVLVVPRGIWHRMFAATLVTCFGVTSVGEDEVSLADDPR